MSVALDFLGGCCELVCEFNTNNLKRIYFANRHRYAGQKASILKMT